MLYAVLNVGPYNLSFNLSQFNFTIENGYDRIRGIDMLSTADTGAPELPVKSLNFIHPNGTSWKGSENDCRWDI